MGPRKPERHVPISISPLEDSSQVRQVPLVEPPAQERHQLL